MDGRKNVENRANIIDSSFISCLFQLKCYYEYFFMSLKMLIPIILSGSITIHCLDFYNFMNCSLIWELEVCFVNWGQKCVMITLDYFLWSVS